MGRNLRRNEALRIRPATIADLDAIVTLTRDRRAALAAWEPTYWRPSEGADALHPLFLRFSIENPAASVFVADGDGALAGCVFVQPQPGQWFLDDFCVVGSQWSEVGAALIAATEPATSTSPAFVCAPTGDRALLDWLATSGAHRVSSYRVVRLDEPSSGPPNGSAPGIVGLVPRGAPHTFGASIDPTVAGGLRIADPRGVLVGSAPLTPPIYDPGGPSTVIDRVFGDDRAGLLKAGLDISQGRGDVQVIVVCAAHDAELDEILDRHGAHTPVEVWQVLTGPTPGT